MTPWIYKATPAAVLREPLSRHPVQAVLQNKGRLASDPLVASLESKVIDEIQIPAVTKKVKMRSTMGVQDSIGN